MTAHSGTDPAQRRAIDSSGRASAGSARRNWALRGMALLLGAAASLSAWAEGSRSMYPAGYEAAGFRATMDLRNNGNYMGIIPARQFLYVYAEANEYILLGSRNRNNGTSGEIFVYNPQNFGTKGAETIPGTANFACTQTTPPAGSYSGTTLGQIGSRAAELAGPNSADNSVSVGANGYAPCAYRAPVSGIYGVRFAGGASGTTVDGLVATPQILTQQVSAWDVTVRATASSITDLNGRLFTYAWVGYTGSNPRAIYHTLYYTTLDGYRYRQKMQGIDPNAYALYANSGGFMDEGSSLYKDIRGNNQFVDSGFPAGVTAQRPQDPIFFSDITPTGANAAEVNKVFTFLGIPSTPPVPQLSAVSFTGNVGGSTSTQGAGGTFQFTTVNTVSFQIVISAGANFDPGDTSNRVITGTAGTGTHTIVWDGKSNAGTDFPAGGPYSYRVTGRNGEIHFPIIDTEGNASGGPTMTKLNASGDSVVYYDDRSYVTRRNVTVGAPINSNLCGAGSAQVPPTPPYNLIGVDSSVATAGRYYRWWTASGNNNTDCNNNAASAFGDAKGLDLWSYASTGDITETLIIVPQTVTRDLGTAVSVDPTANPGQTVYGSFVFRNDGTGSATVSSVTASIGTPGNCPASVTFTYVPPGLTAVYSAATCNVTFTGITTMTAGQQYLFRFTYPAPASGTVPVNTTIAGNETVGAVSPNSASGVTVITVADVAASVSVPPTAAVGSTVAGTITFGNYSPGNATADTVIYSATIGTPGSCPSGVAFPAPPAGVTLSYNTSTCEVLFSGMPAQLTLGQSVSINFTYTAPASGTVPVTASISTSTPQVTTANDSASGSTSFFVPVANLGIAKTGPAVVAANGAISYSLLITNAGPDAANNASYVDNVPAGITGVAATCTLPTGGAVCAAPTVAGNAVSGTVPTLPNGGSVTITITGTAPAAATTLNNTATVTAPPGTTDPTPGNNSSSTTTPVVLIVADDDSYGSINGNSGNANVGNVLGNDSLNGAAATIGNVTIGIVTPASNAGVTLDPATGIVAVAPGTPANSYTIVYRICSQANPTICDNATVTIVVTAPSADVRIAKTGPAVVAANGAISYSLLITNAGPDAANNASYADNVPAGITGVAATCTLPTGGAVCAAPTVAGNSVSGTVPTLPNGGSVTITITGTAPASATTLNNTATVTAPPGTTDPTPGNNSSSTTTPVVLIVADDDSYGSINGNSGNANVGNVLGNDSLNGAAATIGNVTIGIITPALNAGVTLDPATGIVAVAPGTPANSYTIVYRICSQANPTICDNATVTIVVTAPSADVRIAKTGPAVIAANGAISYSLLVSNTGPDAANNASYADNVPAGITGVAATCTLPTGGALCAAPTVAGNAVSGTVPTLPNGGSVTITITGTAPASATTLNNTATVTAPPGTTDPTPGNNSSSTTTPVVLIVADDDSYGPINGNSGNANVGNVLGNDSLNGAAATIGNVTIGIVTPASNAGVTLDPATGIVAVAPGTPANSYTIVYRICSQANPTICDNATVTVVVTAPSADVRIAKTGPAVIAANGAISYSLLVSNAGADAANNASYADNVPAGITGVAATCTLPTGGAVCAAPTVAGNAVSGTVPTLPNGGSVTITITGTAPAAATTLNNTATVTAPPGTTDPTPGNNSSSTTTQVNALSSLSISKTDNATTYTPGSTATYVLLVTNAGPSAATAVALSDTLPSGVTLSGTPTCTSSGTASCGSLTGVVGTGSFSVSGASVGAAGGDSLSYSLPVSFDSALAAASLTNTATVQAPSDPAGPHSASDTDTLAAVSDLAVVKTDNSATYTPGTTASYVITVSNAGPSDAHNVGVSDSLPAGVTLTGTPTCVANGIAACGSVSSTASSFSSSGGAIGAGAGNALVFTLPVAFASNLSTNPLQNVATATDPADPDGASGVDIDTLVATSGLSIAKTDSSATYVPGGSATYVVTLQNSGPSDANAISVSDTLPAGVTLSGTPTCAVSGTALCGSITGAAGGSSFSVSGARISAGAGNSLAYSLPVTFAASLVTDPLVNTATASDPQDPTGPHNASDSNNIAATVALNVAKTDGMLSYTPGTNGTYSVTVTNAGPSDAHAVAVSDGLPAGVSLTAPASCSATGLASCGTLSNTASSFSSSNGSIAAGAGNALVFTLPVTFAASLSTNPLVNVATATDPSDPDGASGSDTDSLTALTGLNVTKTDGSATYTPGGSATYTVVVTNAGPSNASGVSLSDPLPAGVTLSAAATCVASGAASCGSLTGAAGAASVSLSGAAIAAGAGNALTLSLPVNFAADLTANPLANTVSVSDSADPTPRTATDNNAVNFVTALSIGKDDGASSYTPGGTATYVITVRNAGPSDATGVSVADSLPAGVTLAALPTCQPSGAAVCGTVNGTVGGSNAGLSAATLPAGAANVLRLSVPVQFASSLTVNPLVNTATASDSSGAPPVSGSDSNTRVGAGSLQVSKTDGSATYVPGGTAVYTIVVSNTGLTDANAVSVSDPLPPGVTLEATPSCVAAGSASCGTISGALGGTSFSVANASVAAGAGNQLSYSVPVRFAASLAANPLVNTVTVSDPASPSASASDSNTPAGQVGLVLTKTDNSATYTPGGSAVYVITLGNSGPSNANGIALSDPLPAGVTLTAVPSCVASGTASCGSIAGATGGSSFSVANASVAAGAGNLLSYSLPVAIAANVTANPLLNTVTATAPGSNGATASDSNTLLAATGLTVTKDDGATTYVPGGNAVYVIEVANGGPSNANAIALSDPLPAGVTLTGTPTCVVSGSGSCGSISGTAGGSSFGVTAASLAAGAANRLSYSVPVAFAANMTANPLVNSVTATDPSDPLPHTAIDSNVRDPQADIGVVKVGPATAERGQPVVYDFTVTNAGPSDAADVQLIDPTPPGLSYVSSTAPCAAGFPCSLGTLANGATVTFSVVYAVDPGFAGSSIVNTVTVSSSTPDPNGSNSSSSVATPLGDTADVAVGKTGPATATSLQSVAYVVTVRNNGPSVAQAVMLDDPTPAGLQYVSASAPCAAGFPCSLGNLAVGQSVAVTVNYTVRATATALQIVNTATATSTTPDPNPGNNSGSQTTQVAVVLTPPVPVPASNWFTLLLILLGLGTIGLQQRRVVARR